MDGITIKLTPEKSLEYFFNSLCNSLGYFTSYGFEVDFNEEEYKKSKEKLTSPSYEEVFIQMLKDGYGLTVNDIENDGEYTTTIYLKDVVEKVQKTPIRHLSNMINEEDDADTGDVILQTVFFDEVVFG